VRLATGRFFLRVYEEQGRAGALVETRLLAHLAARGVPTPNPVARIDGSLVSEVKGKPAALFPWVEGRMRCQSAVEELDCERVGAALARVHLAGDGAVHPVGRFGESDLCARMERIEQAGDPTLAAQAAPLRAKLERWSGARDPSLLVGLVHGD